MATASVYIYNETKNDVTLSSTSKNMKTGLPSSITVKAGNFFHQDVQTIGQTSTFTLTVDPTHLLATTVDDSNNFSITPSTFDDGNVGALVAPTTLSGSATQIDILNYFIGDGEPVAYLNGLLSALVPPAVAEVNKLGPYSTTINAGPFGNIPLELDTLTLPAEDVSCTYASRQGTGPASFNMQAIINISAINAAGKFKGSASTFSTAGLAILITFDANANPSNLSLQVKSLQVALAKPLAISAFFPIPGSLIAQKLNSSPENETLIKLLNAKLGGAVGGQVSTMSTELTAENGEAPEWADAVVSLLEHYREV